MTRAIVKLWKITINLPGFGFGWSGFVFRFLVFLLSMQCIIVLKVSVSVRNCFLKEVQFLGTHEAELDKN